MSQEKCHRVVLVKKSQSLFKVGAISLTLLICPVFVKALFFASKDVQNTERLHHRKRHVQTPGLATDVLNRMESPQIREESGANIITPLPPSGLITYR